MIDKTGKVRYKNTKEWMQNIVFSYLEKYPNLPALTLSKLIYKENSNVFKSIENIRGYIRVYRKSPKNNNVKNKDFLIKKNNLRIHLFFLLKGLLLGQHGYCLLHVKRY